MKAILLAFLFGGLLLACAWVGLNRAITESRVRLLLAIFLCVLPLLLATHLWTPPDLGFLPLQLVTPLWWVDLGFCVFLYAAGFFGGVLQLYNLADRGFSLRIMIDILQSPRGSLAVDDVMTCYSAGRGIAWMYEKRLEGMAATGLVRIADTGVVLTFKGCRLATLFAALQRFAREYPPKEAEQ